MGDIWRSFMNAKSPQSPQIGRDNLKNLEAKEASGDITPEEQIMLDKMRKAMAEQKANEEQMEQA